MKTLLTTIALSTISTFALAEPTQFTIPDSRLDRVEVRASVDRNAVPANLGEATVFTLPAMSMTTRAQVLAELAADRAHRGHGESSTLRFQQDFYHQVRPMQAGTMGSGQLAGLAR